MMLMIEPLGGLCNRMRALDSALALATNLGHDLAVRWYRDPSLNCRFNDLFVLPDGISEISDRNGAGFVAQRLQRPSEKMWSKIRGRYVNDAEIVHLKSQGYAFSLLGRHRLIYVSTCQRFMFEDVSYQAFVPVAPLRAQIAAITAEFSNVVGVHIRRSDHTKAIAHSPTTLFIKHMQKEIDADEAVRFFVATDSTREEALLRQHFPGRILTNGKSSVDRNNPRSIQDALVDLYCLAACRKLIGSYWSSFSETAWQMGNIDKVIVSD